VSIIRVDRGDFWNHWTTLNVAVDKAGLFSAWYRALEEAALELDGGALGDLSRSLAGLRPDAVPEELRKLADRMSALGKDRGEPGVPQTVQGKQPHEIVRKVRERIISAGFPLPEIARMSPISS
jgi:hypothetical protein